MYYWTVLVLSYASDDHQYRGSREGQTSTYCRVRVSDMCVFPQLCEQVDYGFLILMIETTVAGQDNCGFSRVLDKCCGRDLIGYPVRRYKLADGIQKLSLDQLVAEISGKQVLFAMFKISSPPRSATGKPTFPLLRTETRLAPALNMP